jgi:sigma-B regulation protein RsbU (phosphoserine phosphatase)
MHEYSSQDRLALLYRLSQTFNSSLDLNEVLNRVMDEVITVMHAERGFLMLREADESLSLSVARGIDHKTLAAGESSFSRGVIQGVVTDGKPVLTDDAQLDMRFMGHQSVKIHGLRSIICVPLSIKDQVSGVIYIDNRLQAGLFTDADLDLLAAIASSAAIAIENARLYQVAVEKGRMERELQVARQVQANLLPQEMPHLEGWEFAARWEPAREVAGDYYDLFEVEDGKLGVVIADVADKGMPAALFMASTRSIVRATLNGSVWPARGVAQTNQLLCSESSQGMFVTLFFLLLEEGSGEVFYVNAGHNPPIHYQARQDQLSYLSRTGMALGVDAGAVFEQRKIVLEEGDFLFLYTDGVTDALDARGSEYGIQRLEKVVQAMRHAPASEIIAALDRSIENFMGSSAPYDDITIVAVKKI